MLKRIAIKGFIEVPDAYSFPDKEHRLQLANVVVEVTGIHDDIQKRRGEVTEQVVTLKTNLTNGAKVTKVLPPEGNDPNQTTLTEPTPIRKPAARKATRKRR